MSKIFFAHFVHFYAGSKRSTFGPGHNCFTKNEKGEDVLVYHARFDTKIEGDPLDDPNRHTCLMKFIFCEDGPKFAYKEKSAK